MSSRDTGQRGHSPAVEAAVIIPALVLLVGLLIVTARLVIAEQAVAGAASAAARAASLERTVATANGAAHAAAEASLQDHNVVCVSRSVEVDASGLRARLGEPATVEAHVQCTVALGDVALPGFPGSHTISASRSSPVDTYRQR